MQRRTFLVASAGGISLAGCRPWMRPDPAPKTAGFTPHQKATIAAMASTFLPSAPGSPGADEARAVEVILDPDFEVGRWIDEVVADLDDWCLLRHGGRRFVTMDARARERALEERMGLHGRLIQSAFRPVYEGILALTKLAFYGGLAGGVGTRYVGFPGAATGYAPGSAAGAWFADVPALEVSGDGRVSSLSVSVARGAGAGVLVAPDGSRHALPDGVVEEHPVSSARTRVAAGTWRIETPALAYWALVLRTDLDEVR